MQNKLNKKVLLGIIIILLIIGLVYIYLKQKENQDIISTEQQTTLDVNSCISDNGKIMTYQKALEIAKASNCINIGNFTGEYSCNQNAGGLIDVYMNPSDKPSCGFACRVSIDTEKIEEGWMCTGVSSSN